MNLQKSVAMATLAFLAQVLLLSPSAQAETNPHPLQSWVAEHEGTTWLGSSELWIDPSGNDGDVSKATLRVVDQHIRYTWVYKGVEQQGVLHWSDNALHWNDSWHQPEAVVLTAANRNGSLVAGKYSYGAGSGPDWHWRIKFSQRPDDSMVLQMTNIAPWGEEARAVRTVVQRQK